MPRPAQTTDTIRRMLLQRILTDHMPRGGVSFEHQSGALVEVLQLRAEYDDALRRRDRPAAEAVRARARQMLLEEKD